MNICILLAAGKSIRFGTSSKQLHVLPSGETVLETCIETLLQVVDKIIIVTNDIVQYKNRRVICIPNNISCRLKSIEAGLHYIRTHYSLVTKKVLIHDVARPFITCKHIQRLLSSRYKYSQYCLKLTNGLIYKGVQCVDRDAYLELCTPICIEYNLFCRLKVPNEFIDLLKPEEYELVHSHYKYLRKITTIDDT